MLLNRINKLLPVPLQYKVWMSDNELGCFDKYIRKVKHYLEFGCGGSTIRTLIKSECQITSVESSKEWIDELREYKIIRKAEKESRLRFIEADIGPVGARGYPIDGGFRPSFPDYSSSVFQNIRADEVDCVFIDGRFRIACTLQTVLKISNPDLIILFHDIWARKQYHMVLKYLVEIERKDSMGVFRVYNRLDREELEKVYEIYKHVPM